MKVKAFITHKLCERYADCQDRFRINKDRKTLAVSDGMSQSIFPERWAELLALQYTNEGHCTDEDRKVLSKKWLESVLAARQAQVDSGKDPWMLDNMLAEKRGAGATICGVIFENATDWQGDVLGDSCIIEIDKQKGKATILSSEDKVFDSYPDFYDSFADKQGRGTIKHFTGTIGEDNLLLLASDPFSEFFQKSKDNCCDLIKQILQLNSHEDFCALVDNWREAGMHNDDSTLCVIEFDNDINMNVIHSDDIQDFINKEQIPLHEETKEGIEIIVEKQNDEEKTGKKIQLQEDVKNDNKGLDEFHNKVMSVLAELTKKVSEKIWNLKERPNKKNKRKFVPLSDVEDAKEKIDQYYQLIKGGK